MQIGNFELESQIINGGGVVKNSIDARQMAQTGVGAVLGGSFTLDSKIGNSPNGETVYYHDPVTGITYNSLGMPNMGIRELAKHELSEMIEITHDHGKPFILNFAPITEDPVTEIIEMGMVLADSGIEGLDGLEINASCPNVVMEDGSRHELLSHHPEKMKSALLVACDVSLEYLPVDLILVRISPFRSQDDVVSTVLTLKESGVGAVVGFNTFPGGVPVDEQGNNILDVPGGAGGQSGAGMCSDAEEQTRWLAQAADFMGCSFDIVGSNGVHDAASMKKRIDLGASAVSLTTLFFESPNWSTAVDNLLQEYSEIV
jgi:dihydroorotate dehydrogenase